MLVMRSVVSALRAAWPAKYGNLGTHVKAGKYQAVLVTRRPGKSSCDVERISEWMTHDALVAHLSKELAVIREWVRS
jgi:hypothetical protein